MSFVLTRIFPGSQLRLVPLRMQILGRRGLCGMKLVSFFPVTAPYSPVQALPTLYAPGVHAEGLS